MIKIIHCDCKDCIYWMDKGEKEGMAYRYQCGNDEIEIGDDKVCCSYEKNDN